MVPTPRRSLAAAAAVRGYQVIDFELAFLERPRADGPRREAAPTDSHWNELGHRVVADEIQRSRAFQDGALVRAGTR